MSAHRQTVLLTGGCGFIGSHVLERLVHEYAHVKVLVHYNSLNLRGFVDMMPKEQIKNVEFIQGDLRDLPTTIRAVRGCDVVLHLGALIAIPYSYQSPLDVLQTNAIGTFNVAQACLDHGVTKVVHTSTSEVYGTAQTIPMNECHPLQGQSPYSASKIAADKVMESFYHSYGLPVITVRPFNAYGPRQSMRAVIPTIINQVEHLGEVRLGNLTPTRDFTFVEDTARAFLKAAESTNAFGEVVNAGSGREISIADLATKICSIMGRDVPVVTTQSRVRPESSEVNRLCSDSSKAKSLFGWEPEISLGTGLERTIEWVRANKHLYRHADYVV